MNEKLITDSDFARLDFDITQNPDRRKTNDDIMNLIVQMFVELRLMRTEYKDLRIELSNHIKDEMMILTHAFPDGDPDGHRRAHEAWVLKAESQAKVWEDLKLSVIKWGVIGFLGFLAVAGWKLFLQGPK
jgi:hypothetical protein